MKPLPVNRRYVLPEKDQKPFRRWVIAHGDQTESPIFSDREREVLALHGLSDKHRHALDTSLRNRELINQMVNGYFGKKLF